MPGGVPRLGSADMLALGVPEQNLRVIRHRGHHDGRALFGIFMDAYGHVLDRGRRAPRMKRSGNGDPIGLMKFEEHVRETIEAGLRDYLTRGRGQQR